MKHMLSLMDWSADELRALMTLARKVKGDPGVYSTKLAGKTLAMIFEKSSTRTRVSFEVGMRQLGGNALFLSKNDLQLGRGETVADTARVLSRYVDCIMARVFAHATVVELTCGDVPVINGLSDLLHPCQALADVQTIVEHKGGAEGVTVAYLGDGNNVCHSLINAAARFGFSLRVGAPESRYPSAEIVEAARAEGADITLTADPGEAVSGVDVIYTDVWASMGEESEAEARHTLLAPFQVNETLFAQAAPDAIFMHCLPAHRGEEVTDAVVDHKRSVIFDQAENRMHAQKALLLTLL